MSKILVMIDDNDLKKIAYRCIETMDEDEPGILFIHNGAYLPVLDPDKNKIQEFTDKKIPLYGIFRDFMLRGLEAQVEDTVELVDYNEFIELIIVEDTVELVDYNEFIELIMDEYEKVVSFL